MVGDERAAIDRLAIHTEEKTKCDILVLKIIHIECPLAASVFEKAAAHIRSGDSVRLSILLFNEHFGMVPLAPATHAPNARSAVRIYVIAKRR